MKNVTAKSKSKMDTKMVSQRIFLETKKVAEDKLKMVNDKRFGRKVKPHELLHFALGMITEEQIKILQKQSLTNEDRKELLRQKYIEVHGPISEDAFTGFLMSDEFLEFKRKYQGVVDAFLDPRNC